MGDDDDDVLEENIGTAIFRTGFTVGSINNLRKLFSTRNNESSIISQYKLGVSNIHKHGYVQHYSAEGTGQNGIPSSQPKKSRKL